MRISILAMFLFCALPVIAAEGDAKAGQAKAAVCAGCHGMDGNSAMPLWPKLAGQHAEYLLRQLQLIKRGERSVPEMTGFVANLSDQDMADIAAFYKSQQIQYGNAEEKHLAPGEKIYRAGDANTGVAACIACHGPHGLGNPVAGYPALAGQHAAYTAKVLKAFRSGKGFGKDKVGMIMPGVAKQMSDADIEAVASYLQGLHRAE